MTRKVGGRPGSRVAVRHGELRGLDLRKRDAVDCDWYRGGEARLTVCEDLPELRAQVPPELSAKPQQARSAPPVEDLDM